MQHALRPQSQQDPKFPTQYERFVIPGDTFDISNLRAKSGRKLAINLLSAIKTIAQNFYGAVPPPGPDVDGDFLLPPAGADHGRTPIEDLVITGHSEEGPTRMFGDLGSHQPGDFSPEDPPVRDVNDAINGNLPRRCWFTINATVRSVGCKSKAYGELFGAAYLRIGSKIITTISDVQPGCASQVSNPGAVCPNNQLNGLAFVRGFFPVIQPNGGPFFNRASFEAAPYWATIHGKL